MLHFARLLWIRLPYAIGCETLCGSFRVVGCPVQKAILWKQGRARVLIDPPEANGDCIFLEGGNRCGTYEARPEQCRTWPFWPENMKAKTWRREIETYCPGVGKGRLHTREEIETILKEQEQG